MHSGTQSGSVFLRVNHRGGWTIDCKSMCAEGAVCGQRLQTRWPLIYQRQMRGNALKPFHVNSQLVNTADEGGSIDRSVGEEPCLSDPVRSPQFQRDHRQDGAQ